MPYASRKAAARSAALTIPLVVDGAPEPSESVVLALANPGPGVTLAPVPTATLWILDDDS